MAQRPNWAQTIRAYSDRSYWVDTTTVGSNGVYNNSGYLVYDQVNVSNPVVDSGSRAYSTTPGFNSPRRPEYVPPLAYEATFTKYKSYQYYRNVQRGANNGGMRTLSDTTYFSYNVNSGINPLVDPGTDDVVRARLRDKATRKLLSKLGDFSVNLAQAFAEREMTAKTVASTVTTVAKVLRGLKSGNFSAAAKAIGIAPPKRGQRRFNKAFANDSASAAANGWLALQYGWKPLLNDVYDSATTLAKAKLNGENGNTVYNITSGHASQKWEERSRTKGAGISGYSGIDEIRRELNATVHYRVSVRFAKSSPVYREVSQLGITNPALILWELTPYSFVVDWFLPIGNYIQSLDATTGLAFQSGFITRFTKYRANNARSIDLVSNSSPSFVSEVYTEEYVRDTVVRGLLSSFPSAPLPRFKNPLSFSHVTSALALLKQFKR